MSEHRRSYWKTLLLALIVGITGLGVASLLAGWPQIAPGPIGAGALRWALMALGLSMAFGGLLVAAGGVIALVGDARTFALPRGTSTSPGQTPRRS
jgi:hypothetical protein